MKKILELFSKALRLPAKAPANGEAILQEIDRQVISTHSHGNILLQMGLYYTKADINKEYEYIRQNA